jgi:hypothetical protein
LTSKDAAAEALRIGRMMSEGMPVPPNWATYRSCGETGTDQTAVMAAQAEPANLERL